MGDKDLGNLGQLSADAAVDAVHHIILANVEGLEAWKKAAARRGGGG